MRQRRIGKFKLENFEFMKPRKKFLLFVLAFILIVPSIVVGAGSSSESQKVVRPKASEVDNMTLVIGTHMIALEALTEELNEIAQKTVQDSGQDKIYYKSELTDYDRGDGDNDGIWYEVQNAKDVGDISVSSNKVVSDELIDGLVLAYYTDREGHTYDLNNGQEVDIYNIVDVYDILTMSELESLKLEYDVKKSLNPEDQETEEEKNSLIKVQNSLDSVFGLQVKDEETSKLDLILESLKKYFDYVVSRGATSQERDTLTSIRGAVDAQRKEIIINKVLAKLDEEMARVDALSDSYNNAKNELINSQLRISSQKFVLESDEDSTLIQKNRSSVVQSLITNAQKNDYELADENLKDILALDDVASLIVSDSKRQLNLVNNLIQQAQEQYYDLVFEGESDEYEKAKVQNKSQAVLDNIKTQYQSKLKSLKQELVLLYEMKLKLLETVEEKQRQLKSDIDDLLKKIGQLSAEIKQSKQVGSDILSASQVDAFKGIALNSLRELLDSLNGKLSLLQDFINSNNDELMQQTKRLDELKEEYKKALDRNDLAAAKDAKDQLDELQKEIDQSKSDIASRLAELKSQFLQIQNQLNSGNLSVAEQSALEAQKLTIGSEMQRLNASMSDRSKTSGSLLQQSVEDAQRVLSGVSVTEQDVRDLEDSISTIKSMIGLEPQAAYQAAVQVSEALALKNGDESWELASLIELESDILAFIDENKDVYDESEFGSHQFDRGAFEETVSVFAQDENLSDVAKDILTLGALSELMGYYGSVREDMSIEDLNSQQKDIRSLMVEVMQRLNLHKGYVSEVNAVLVDQKVKNNEVYAPAETVAEILEMRYVWDRSLVQGWLIDKEKKYGFVQGKNNVVVSDGKNKTMSNIAFFESDKNSSEAWLWLPQSFLGEEFQVVVQSLNIFPKSIVYDEKSYEKMKDLFAVVR